MGFLKCHHCNQLIGKGIKVDLVIIADKDFVLGKISVIKCPECHKVLFPLHEQEQHQD